MLDKTSMSMGWITFPDASMRAGMPNLSWGNHSPWSAVKEIVQLVPVLAADFYYVFKAGIGDYGRPDPFSLQNCIGGHGGAVHYLYPVECRPGRPRKVRFNRMGPALGGNVLQSLKYSP